MKDAAKAQRHKGKLKLIEGRKHNVYLSFKVVQPTQDEELKQQYIANRSFDDNHFKEMILEYLKLGKAKRKAINELVIPKLSAALTEDQKRNKVTNYLASLRREGKIESLPGYYWRLI